MSIDVLLMFVLIRIMLDIVYSSMILLICECMMFWCRMNVFCVLMVMMSDVYRVVL